MKEFEALMIGPNGEHMVVAAHGETIEDAIERAEKALSEMFPGWTIVVTGEPFSK